MENRLLENLNIKKLKGTILICGAGGTIGKEVIKKIKAEKIIAVDISEYSIYKLERELGPKIDYIVGDISDKKLVDLIFKKYKIDYVLNAAAYKHVDRMENENNHYSVIKNNILGLINLCEKLNSGVKEFIHISSDKAVNPINYMGFTKLWCENIVKHYSKHVKTKMSIIRFGNVYNSSGSFVETLKWQVENKLPITITDKRMKRYFMMVDDAVKLITDVFDLEKENYTYILNMGEQISIESLAREIAKDYNIKYIGIRAGEKLQEELFYEFEILEKTKNNLISKIKFNDIDFGNNIKQLMFELNREIICTKKLTEIIETITIS